MGPFGRPSGLLGRLAGRIMARGNADMEREAVRLLRLGGGERVLEIGFGPGVGIAELVRAVPRGRVCGLDPSPLMLQEAARRNRATVDAGPVELRLGTADRIPWEDGAFDAVVSVNNVMLWQPLDASLREVRRVTRAGGRLVVAVHGWSGRGRDLAAEVGDGLAAYGFAGIALHRRPANSGEALYWH